MKKPYTSFVTGLLVGVALFSGTTAYAAGIMAERSTHRIYVDGREVQMETYVINGNNYVKLRDIARLLVSRFIGIVRTAVCRWRAENLIPAKNRQRTESLNPLRSQNPQSPPMMPMWMP